MRLIDFMFDAKFKYQSLPQIEHGCLTQKKLHNLTHELEITNTHL